MSRLRRLWGYLDPFLVALLATVGLASLLPARGGAAEGLSVAADVAVAFLFFLYGNRLATRAALAAVRDWKLHGTVLAVTFVAYPLLGLLLGVVLPALLPEHLLPADLVTGIVFLTLLPSTVNSSIAFTSLAGGNVPAAICAASFSNLLGVLLTPLLVAALLGGQVQLSTASVGAVALQVLAPFLAGQLTRRWLGPWVGRHKRTTQLCDRGAILLVVYTAFSSGVVDGLWQRVSAAEVGVLLAACAVLLAAGMGLAEAAGRALGFGRADRLVVLFCGSKKSLATGVPMATLLLPAATVGTAVLPLMLFHQVQLLVCAVIARRAAAVSGASGRRHRPGRRRRTPPTTSPSSS
ncbi:bile acid:sodium symporter family protein [Kineococcus glutinatus]|uniref:Bile acid:sodium symporter n=1 Tax=Kineococcus glutinatus TaxID=1070872 RepID=A0ABP9HTC6_9ACTN